MSAVRVADRLEIQELVARYNLAIDSGDVDSWVATFTPDGVFDGVVGRFEGADALRAFVHAYWTEPEWERWRRCQHWVGNLVVDPIGEDGDRVRLRCQHLMVSPGEPAEILLVAHYNDELVRTSAGWRFAQRTVREA